MKLSAITGKKIDPMAFVIILLLSAITITILLFLYRKETKEAFSQLGASLSDSMGDGVRSSWLNSDKTPIDNNKYSRMETTTSTPLPESEMLIFNNNKFTPECCPSTYSNSTGCLCATPEQLNYLNSHGGNRTVGGAPNEF
jgi:hypothetical protein